MTARCRESSSTTSQEILVENDQDSSGQNPESIGDPRPGLGASHRSLKEREEVMRTKTVIFAGILAMMVSPVFAQEYILITHSDGTDPFWPVVQKGAEDAAKQVGATLTYRHPNRVDAPEMAQIIEASIAQKPAGMIISILDPEVIGPAIKAAVDAGIPVVSINSGDKFARKYGALFHVGQPEGEAGMGAGARSTPPTTRPRSRPARRRRLPPIRRSTASSPPDRIPACLWCRPSRKPA